MLLWVCKSQPSQLNMLYITEMCLYKCLTAYMNQENQGYECSPFSFVKTARSWRALPNNNGYLSFPSSMMGSAKWTVITEINHNKKNG